MLGQAHAQLLVVEPDDLAIELLAAVEVGLAGVQVTEAGDDALLQFGKLLLAVLDLAGGRLHRLLQPGQPVPPLLIPLVQVPLHRGQFVAELV